MEYTIVILAWICGGFINNITGMGGAIVAIPIMTLLLPLKIAIPISCVCGAIICTYLTIYHIKYVNYNALFSFTIGSIPGVYAGIFILLYIPAKTLQIAIGIFLISYSFWQYFSKLITGHPENRFIAIFAGFISGLTNSSISFGGPPAYAYSIYVGWDRNNAIGTISFFYCLLSVLTIYKQVHAGLFTFELLSLTLLAAIGLGIGILLSSPVIKKINNKNYRMLLIVIIFISGFVCLLKGILG